MTRSEARPPGRLRRRLVLGGVLIFLPLGDGAAARLTGRSWTIGFLNIGSEAGSGHLLEAFRKGMRELGYVEGQQYTLDALWANGDISRLGPLAEELVRKPVDLIVTSGPPQVRAVQAATHRIPVVMANLAETFRHAATFVDRIFKGAAPGDIPFEQATKFELVVNTRTAKLLGIRIPRTVLLRADEFI
jgi:ABC-type uncharacterized transport system substrate-binding protein